MRKKYQGERKRNIYNLGDRQRDRQRLRYRGQTRDRERGRVRERSWKGGRERGEKLDHKTPQLCYRQDVSIK